jgi:hypothetical protein
MKWILGWAEVASGDIRVSAGAILLDSPPLGLVTDIDMIRNQTRKGGRAWIERAAHFIGL